MQYSVDVDQCIQLTVFDCNMDAGLNSDIEVWASEAYYLAKEIAYIPRDFSGIQQSTILPCMTTTGLREEPCISTEDCL